MSEIIYNPIWAICLMTLVFIWIGINLTEVSNGLILTPYDIYDNTKFNIVTCYVFYIFIRIFNLLCTLIIVGYVVVFGLYTFFNWLFTVGRKD